jgi:hypothetical protein
MKKIIKLTFILLLTCFIGLVVYMYQNLRFSTPSLLELAQSIPKFSSALAYNYSKNIDKQLYLFSKNIGLENNPYTQQSIPKEGELGATGFLVFDIKPQFSSILFQKIDNLLNEYFNIIEQSNANISNSIIHTAVVKDEVENNIITSESPLNSPTTELIEEIFNGKTLLFGGATQFYLNFEDTLMLSLEPLTKNYIQIKSSFFRDMLIKNIPLYLQELLSKHSIHVDIEPAVIKLDNEIHQSQIIFSVIDSNNFIDSICAKKINPWDVCGRFSFKRNKFRNNALALINLFGDNFQFKLNFYWAIRGKDLIFANNREFVSNLLDSNNQLKQKNILIDVANSGDDFLFSRRNSLKYSSLSFYFDMIKIQNEGIYFIDELGQKSKIIADYFSSPKGQFEFREIEKKINDITSVSQKASAGFKTDGEKLYPEIRLFSPSNDLFINNGSNLSPEVITSLRIFVTKAISFGHYLLPKGLIAIPGPYLKRNGRWVILNSDIHIKSISPYMQSIDPFIDLNDTPSEL